MQVSTTSTTRSGNLKNLSFPERKIAFMEEARRLLEMLQEQILYLLQEIYFQTWTLIGVAMVCYVHELEPQSFPVLVSCS